LSYWLDILRFLAYNINKPSKGRKQEMKNGYNGWKNRETWNVALWINNDETTYREACAIMNNRLLRGKPHIGSYRAFVLDLGLKGQKTPDGVAWMSPDLDYAALDEMMAEMVG